MNGKGTYEWNVKYLNNNFLKDGRVFKGTYKDDLKHGEGELIFPDSFGI
jgi:hypothetical protein